MAFLSQIIWTRSMHLKGALSVAPGTVRGGDTLAVGGLRAGEPSTHASLDSSFVPSPVLNTLVLMTVLHW